MKARDERVETLRPERIAELAEALQWWMDHDEATLAEVLAPLVARWLAEDAPLRGRVEALAKAYENHAYPRGLRYVLEVASRGAMTDVPAAIVAKQLRVALAPDHYSEVTR